MYLYRNTIENLILGIDEINIEKTHFPTHNKTSVRADLKNRISFKLSHADQPT